VESAAKKFDENDLRPIKLFFQDEGRFGRIGTLRGCWAPGGMRPHLDCQIVRQYTHVFSAVCPEDGASFSLILPYADTEAMTLFLEAFSKEYADFRIIAVMDQAAWHKSKHLARFDNLQIVFQPPYSPELNPVEHLWEHVREKYFWNRSWNSLSELEDTLEMAFREVGQAKDIVRSLSSFDWICFNN
jgi:hypothetical protein